MLHFNMVTVLLSLLQLEYISRVNRTVDLFLRPDLSFFMHFHTTLFGKEIIKIGHFNNNIAPSEPTSNEV